MFKILLNQRFDSIKTRYLQAHFVKFETIAMQAISLLFHDHRSAAWDVRLGKRVIRHCLRILTRWREKSTARAGQQQQVSSFRTSALLFTLTVMVKGKVSFCLINHAHCLDTVSKFDDDNELFKYANKCLREDNLLLHLIMPLSTVQIDDDGCRFIGLYTSNFFTILTDYNSILEKGVRNVRQPGQLAATSREYFELAHMALSTSLSASSGAGPLHGSRAGFD